MNTKEYNTSANQIIANFDLREKALEISNYDASYEAEVEIIHAANDLAVNIKENRHLPDCDYAQLAKVFESGLHKIAPENTLEHFLSVSDELLVEVSGWIQRLEAEGLRFDVYLTEDSYESDSDDEDDEYEGEPMYEGVICWIDRLDDELLDTTSGRYCDLSSILQELVGSAEELLGEAA
jgi:hypothetical protein